MTVLPSVRSELLRDGVEDYEKIQILTEAMRRCERQHFSHDLRRSIDTFTTEALRAGNASRLVSSGRETLNELSRSLLEEC